LPQFQVGPEDWYHIARSANRKFGLDTPPLFTTNFPANENPISQGSSWDGGNAVGTKWVDVKTNAGRAQAVSSPTPNRYDDACAVLRTSAATCNADQYAEGVVDIDNGYTGGGGSHECELWLRGAITTNNARCYECSIGITTAANAPPSGVYCFVVRWEGAEGSYTPLWDPHGSIGSYVNAPTYPVAGDKFRASIKGSVITLYQNGVTLGTVTDTQWSTGQPGLGFWPVDGATPSAMGWKQWSCGNA
jgi:hypothetical protein